MQLREGVAEEQQTQEFEDGRGMARHMEPRGGLADKKHENRATHIVAKAVSFGGKLVTARLTSLENELLGARRRRRHRIDISDRGMEFVRGCRTYLR